MTSKIVATRYARALISLARQNIEKVRLGLSALSEILQRGSELRKLLDHPLIPKEDKRRILADILRGMEDELLVRFVEILYTAKRIEILPDIVEAYNILADEAVGIVRAKVRTPFPVTDMQKENVRKKLAVLTEKQVIIDIEINPALLGGMTIQMGDRVIDGSIQGRLRDLKDKLLEIA